jgi:hypothetical protein
MFGVVELVYWSALKKVFFAGTMLIRETSKLILMTVILNEPTLLIYLISQVLFLTATKGLN